MGPLYTQELKKSLAQLVIKVKSVSFFNIHAHSLSHLALKQPHPFKTVTLIEHNLATNLTRRQSGARDKHSQKLQWSRKTHVE
jgi:hypothetical protein